MASSADEAKQTKKYERLCKWPVSSSSTKMGADPASDFKSRLDENGNEIPFQG